MCGKVFWVHSMPVFFVVLVHIPDPENRALYDAYVRKVKPLVEEFGGRYLCRSEKITRFAGDFCPDRVIIIEFPSREILDQCFHSAAYREIAGFRENSVQTSAFIIEEPTPF